MTTLPISFIIPTKNEEHNLARTLASISWAGEVFVVDSQSSDKTTTIAKAAGAHVVQFHFNGQWPKKRNWALAHLPFTYEWVFFLDADEVLPPSAQEELLQITTAPQPTHQGYWINRKFYFLGKALNHAYYPNWVVRLFQHRLGRYERLTDSLTDSGDHEIHEHVAIQGSCGRLKAELAHHAFPTTFSFIEKHNHYSNWEATVALQAQQVRGRKQKFKHLRYGLPFRPLLRFLYVYIWQKGFLDGWHGYYFARLHGMYELMSVIKEYESKTHIE